MRNSVRTLFGLLAAVIVTLCVASDASAQESDTVIRLDGGQCILLGIDSGLGFNIFSTNAQQIITPSGNIQLVCHFDILDWGPAPNQTIVRKKAFVCEVFDENGLPSGLTTMNTQSIATKGGQATLTCFVHPEPPAE